MHPGDLIAAKYRLERVIGTGAMGEVWAAVNESTRRPVALKLIANPSADLRTRMLREALAAGSLKHRNVVDVYDVGETVRGDPFLVMELLSGETLADRLRRVRRLPPAAAAEIAGAIARALRAAHAKGIIHRDLKPANVFLHREVDAEGDIVKVLDFGVSKQLADASGTVTGGLVGSPAYMSPEQARAESSIDARSDLWSLGAVLFEMLAGRRPFPNSSPYAVIAEVLTAPIPSIAALAPEVSPGLARVVERCLTRDVAARVGSADELIRLLRPFHEAIAGGPRAPLPSFAEPLEGLLDEARGMPPHLPPPAADEPTVMRLPPQLTGVAQGHVPARPPAGPPEVPAFDLDATVTVALRLDVPQETYPLPPIEADDDAQRFTQPLLARDPSASATGTSAPLIRSAPLPIAGRRAPLPVLALALGGVAGAALVVLGIALRWQAPPPRAESAAAAPEPQTSSSSVQPAPSIPIRPTPEPQPAARPEASVAVPRPGENEALIVVDSPEATQVSLDGKPIGSTPMAPITVAAGAHRLFFKHPTLGERVVLVQATNGETSLATAEFDTKAPQPPRPRSKTAPGQKRLVMP